jgi:hypothetical protein
VETLLSEGILTTVETQETALPPTTAGMPEHRLQPYSRDDDSRKNFRNRHLEHQTTQGSNNISHTQWSTTTAEATGTLWSAHHQVRHSMDVALVGTPAQAASQANLPIRRTQKN